MDEAFIGRILSLHEDGQDWQSALDEAFQEGLISEDQVIAFTAYLEAKNGKGKSWAFSSAASKT